MIGIIGAMDVEIEGLNALMQQKECEKISGITFTRGKLMGKDCVTAAAGIGKVNAAVCTQTMILRYAPSAVINSGVAGGIGEGVHIGDIVLAGSVVQHDVDCSPLGDPKGFIPGMDLVHIPASQRLTSLLADAAQNMQETAVHTGVIVTGDQFINDSKTLVQLKETFGGMACEMEGGSIGQVCYLNGVEFAVVRAISDNANDDSHMDYNKFVDIAAEKSIALICRFLENLSASISKTEPV